MFSHFLIYIQNRIKMSKVDTTEDTMQHTPWTPKAWKGYGSGKEDNSSLPVLSLQDVTYKVKEYIGPWWKGACFRKTRTKTVLNNISMTLKSGAITAIIGSSGSGKTSLLDVIACRGDGQISGKLYYRNETYTQEVMRKHASYVMQADRLLPNLTVRETLRYTAYLKLPGYTTSQNIVIKVDEVIQQMGLRLVADSRVGSAIKRGISGGEKRRLTIAIQLLQDPDILMLDEPTSGLDSYTARYLVMNLAELAHSRQKIVLLTIHQPRSDIFKILDHIAILSQGHLTYLGGKDELVPYFTQIGYPCPRYSNPLDVYIDLSSVDRRNKTSYEETQTRLHRIVQTYSESDLYSQIKHDIYEGLRQGVHFSKNCFKKKGPSLFRCVTTLVRRMNLNLYREKQDFINKIVLLSSFVVFIVIFLGRLRNNQQSIQDRAGLLYQAVSVPTHIGMINSIPLIAPIRSVFYRESRDGVYGIAVFLLAYTLHVLPYSIFASVIFSSFLYWAVGMSPEVDKFAMFTAVVFMLYFAGEYFTLAMMGVIRDPLLVNNTTSLVFNASALLATGFVRMVPNQPAFLRYIGYGTMHKYASEIVAGNEFTGLNLTCDQSSEHIPCIFKTGDQYLDDAFPGVLSHLGRNFMVMSGYTLGLTILTFMAFKIRGIPNLH